MSQKMNGANPLVGYFRQPRLYTPLPSKGRFYPEGAIDWPATGEIAIFPMTAKDEMTMRTPDALLNGQATAEVLKSCVPAINDPWQIPSIDLDALLISIRMASYGNNMSVEPTCPKCSNEMAFELDLSHVVVKPLSAQWIDTLDYNELKIGIKPLSYQSINEKALRTFEEQKLISTLEMADDIDVSTKLKRFNASFQFLTGLTMDTVADQVEYILLPNGEKVEDRDFIREFIENADTAIYHKINSVIDNNKNLFSIEPLKIQCHACSHEFEQTLEFDAVNFFVLNS